MCQCGNHSTVQSHLHGSAGKGPLVPHHNGCLCKSSWPHRLCQMGHQGRVLAPCCLRGGCMALLLHARSRASTQMTPSSLSNPSANKWGGQNHLPSSALHQRQCMMLHKNYCQPPQLSALTHWKRTASRPQLIHRSEIPLYPSPRP